MNDVLELRVRVLEAWNDVRVDAAPSTTIGAVKDQVLHTARIAGDPAGFLVKFRGAELRDETRTLADERIPTDAALIVLRRHRVPVR